jgi:hypothetical protein
MLPSGTIPSLALPVVDYMTYHSASVTPTLGLELLHPVVKHFLENRQWHLMFFSQRGLRYAITSRFSTSLSSARIKAE